MFHSYATLQNKELQLISNLGSIRYLNKLFYLAPKNHLKESVRPLVLIKPLLYNELKTQNKRQEGRN